MFPVLAQEEGVKCSMERLAQRAWGGLCLHFPWGLWKEPAPQVACIHLGVPLSNGTGRHGVAVGQEARSLGGKGVAELKSRRAAESLSYRQEGPAAEAEMGRGRDDRVQVSATSTSPRPPRQKGPDHAERSDRN